MASEAEVYGRRGGSGAEDTADGMEGLVVATRHRELLQYVCACRAEGGELRMVVDTSKVCKMLLCLLHAYEVELWSPEKESIW